MPRLGLTLYPMLLAMMLSSCRENQVVGQKPDAGKPVLTVTDLLAQRNFDRVIVVRGTIEKVCQDEGCWMTITDGKSTMRMTFKDEAFQVGLKSKGDVLVTGVVHEEIISEEAAHAIGPTIGMSDSAVQRITGDQRWPLMIASGVEFLQPQP